jgi:hypothetical protein
MSNYDNWKTTNPADEFLGPDPREHEWHPLDGVPAPDLLPERWHGPRVHYGYMNAWKTLRLCPMPSFRIRCLWPEFQLEWIDMLGMLGDGGDAYAQWVREQNLRAREKPTSIEISHMESAFGWPGSYLRRKPMELLVAFQVNTRANALEIDVDQLTHVHRILRHYSGENVRRLCREAADYIAYGLNRDEEPVF